MKKERSISKGIFDFAGEMLSKIADTSNICICFIISVIVSLMISPLNYQVFHMKEVLVFDEKENGRLYNIIFNDIVDETGINETKVPVGYSIDVKYTKDKYKVYLAKESERLVNNAVNVIFDKDYNLLNAEAIFHNEKEYRVVFIILFVTILLAFSMIYCILVFIVEVVLLVLMYLTFGMIVGSRGE